MIVVVVTVIHVIRRIPGLPAMWHLDIPGVPDTGIKGFKWTVGSGRKKC